MFGPVVASVREGVDSSADDGVSGNAGVMVTPGQMWVVKWETMGVAVAICSSRRVGRGFSDNEEGDDAFDDMEALIGDRGACDSIALTASVLEFEDGAQQSSVSV